LFKHSLGGEVEVPTLNERDNIMPNNRSQNMGSRRTRVTLHNLPEYIMYVLGAIIVSYLGIIILIAFVVYIILSNLWFMRFVCTYCPHYDRVKCPSGYAIVASKLFMFKRHMAVVFPAWFVPVIVGIYILIGEFTLQMLILLIAFILIAFVVLPIFSRRYGCDYCDLRDKCPWMGRFGK
jgi:hypothetical protein